MGKMYFKLLNAAEFTKNLKSKMDDTQKQRLFNIGSESALRVLKNQMNDCPYKTGFLRRSHRVFFEKENNGKLGISGTMTDCLHAPPLEFNPKRRAWFFPAWDNERPIYLKNLREEFKDILK